MAGPLVSVSKRYLRDPRIIPLPFFYIGGRRRLQPPILAICQIHGEKYPSGDARYADGIAGTRLIKQNTLSVEYMKNLYRVDTALEADFLAALFGLKTTQQNNEEVVGLETISLPLMKALVFAKEPLSDASARCCKARLLDTIGTMEWVGIRWIPNIINRASHAPRNLQQNRGDPVEMC